MQEKERNLQDPGDWDGLPTEEEKQKSEKSMLDYYKGLERKEQREQMRARSRYLSKHQRYTK